MKSMMRRVRAFGRQLLGRPEPRPASSSAATGAVEPVHPRVLMIVHNPPVPSRGDRRLTQIFGWHDPGTLARGYTDDLRRCSGGYLNYEIAERIDADWYPVMKDGFRYDNDSFIRAWEARTPHEPNAIDYEEQVRRFDLLARHDRGDFDEVWFFSHPYAGDYESTMAGPGAFWCNSPPIPNTEGCRRRFVVMAFNYERDVDCMLENFGHRVESIMSRVYDKLGRGENMWHRFTRYDLTSPGQAECGNVHFAPNSDRDYDWGNPRPVPSFCDDWLTYPDLPRRARTMTAADWGNGDMRGHHLWWLSHLPKAEGESAGIANNWWRYVVDPNLVP
jgi:hypothetical protein